MKAQGLPWETRSNVTSPEAEGAPGFRRVVPGRLVQRAPFRESGDKHKTLGFYEADLVKTRVKIVSFFILSSF
jgi:hypothetical protein